MYLNHSESMFFMFFSVYFSGFPWCLSSMSYGPRRRVARQTSTLVVAPQAFGLMRFIIACS
jgi:apolipoprotein N-acyltransferase